MLFNAHLSTTEPSVASGDSADKAAKVSKEPEMSYETMGDAKAEKVSSVKSGKSTKGEHLSTLHNTIYRFLNGSSLNHMFCCCYQPKVYKTKSAKAKSSKAESAKGESSAKADKETPMMSMPVSSAKAEKGMSMRVLMEEFLP